MKKATVFVMVITFGLIAVQQLATAGPGWRGGYGGGWGCGGPGGSGYGYNRQAPDQGTNQAWEKFYNDTAELREQLYAKRAEYYDVMNQESVDKDMAAMLWGEIFNLQTQIREQAAAAGVKPGYGRGGYPCYGPNTDEPPNTEPSSSGLRS
jgi:Spy/CpxP family protein refolding chaperone